MIKIKIPVAKPELTGNELRYVVQCIKTNWISSAGSFVDKFEREFSNYCGTKYAVSTFNGTVAIHLALLSLKIGEGDEVIVPDLTFVAPANAVTYTGARPVMVDIDEKNWCINPDKIEKKITKKTKAILPVHLYGHPADMGKILEIAKRHNLFVIEDAAEAHGAEYKNKKVGSLGDVGCFSFYGNKIITTGEGGMIVTNNKRIAEMAKFLRNQAMSETRKYFHPTIGFNYRMTNLQAAVGCAQLEKINDIITKKRKIAKIYTDLLSGVEGLTLSTEEKWAKNVYWMFTVVVGKEYGVSKDELARRLLLKGIETRPTFYPIHLLPNYRIKEKFSISTMIGKYGLNLPSGPALKLSEIKYIANLIKKLKR